MNGFEDYAAKRWCEGIAADAILDEIAAQHGVMIDGPTFARYRRAHPENFPPREGGRGRRRRV